MSSRALNTSYSGSMYNQEMKPLDYLYGPWDNIEQMLTELKVTINEIDLGLTVGVIENGKVVEYWNPLPDLGFIKKTSGGGISAKVENYTDAISQATDDNVGNFIFVKNEEVVDGTTYGSGLYLVVSEGEISYVSSNLWYGEFPEDQYMEDDEIRDVTKDGAAKVSDVYRIFKTEQLANRKNLGHLNSHVHWMVSDLDKEEDNVEHTYVSKVENTHGKISLAHKNLDTNGILMSGRDSKDEETFIRVTGTNVGNYKNGDIIKNGSSLEDVLKNLLMKELSPSKKTLPTVTLQGITDKQIYEVGSNPNLTLSSSYVDGKLETFEGVETSDAGKMVNAGCVEVGDKIYEVLKPSDTTYSICNNPFTDDLKEGKYMFKVTCNYSDSITIPKTNFGEDYTDLNISAGSATNTKSIEAKYKFWDTVSSDIDNLMVDGNNTVTSNNNYGEHKWLTKDSQIHDLITLNNGEGYFILCPSNCEPLYDTQMSKNIKPVEGGKYEHVLDNGEIVKYTIYYMLNKGVYLNVRIVEKTNYILVTNSESTTQDLKVTLNDVQETHSINGGGVLRIDIPIETESFAELLSYNEYDVKFDFSHLNTSNVTYMSNMFEGCANLVFLDLSNFDTSNVRSMYCMFESCSGLTSLDLSNFDTSNVTNMQYMFSNCYSLTSLDLSNFDTSNVTNMVNLFIGCNLTSLDLSIFDTSNVTNMESMFENCINLVSLDLSNFDTSNVTKMSWMFYNCSKLNHIKCKQSFKDWCIENQDVIELPDGVTFEVID